MSFMDFVADKESNNQHEKFYGNYRGIVVDNVDPLQNGRCKINVFGVYDNVEEDHLPWATFSDPFMGGLEGFGSTLIPEVDTHVWVFFEGGDVRYPVYFAGAPAMNGKEAPDVPEESRETERETTFYPDDQAGEYPHNKVFKFKSGMTVEFDQTEGAERLRVFHPSGWEMIVNADGDKHTYTPGSEEATTDGDITEEIGGNYDVTISGNLNIRVDGHTELSCPTIDLGESDLEPIILGDKFSDWAQKLTTWLDTHIHVGNLGAPTSPPQMPHQPDAQPAVLSGGNVYSTKNTTQ